MDGVKKMDADPFWKDAAVWIGAVLAGLWAWLARWAWVKLDGKADRAELADFVERQEKRDEEARESRRILHAKIDATNNVVSDTRVAVGRLEGVRSGR